MKKDKKKDRVVGLVAVLPRHIRRAWGAVVVGHESGLVDGLRHETTVLTVGRQVGSRPSLL